MSIRDEVEYNQISQDWRHRDNLTWQLPSVIVAIGGALIVAAFALDIKPCIKPILLGFGAFLSFCLIFALKENLWYQIGSGEALIKIVKGEKIPQNVPRRIVKPEDFGVTNKKELIKKHRLTGSYYLLNFCIIVTMILFGLVISSIVECLISW